VKKQAATGFIFFTVLIDVIGIGVIIPILPDLIIELTGGDVSQSSIIGGFLISIYAVMVFIASPIIGGLSDKYGRKPVLLWALFVLGIDYILMAFAPTILWLFAGRLIAGIGGGTVATANAYIADITEPENRAKSFGLLGAAFGLGFIIGPVMGGFLGEINLRMPFLVSAGLVFINGLYGYFMVPESLDKDHRREFSWKRANPIGTLLQLKKYPGILWLLVSMFIVLVAAHATHTGWVYYTREKFGWDMRDVGISLGFVGVMVSIVQAGLVGPFVKKFGQEKGIYTGLFFNAFGLALIAMATQSWMLYALIVPYALGGLSGPSLQGLMTSRVPKDSQGELQGGITGVMSLTAIVGPLLMMAVFRFYTKSPDAPNYFPGAPYALGAVLALISMVPVWWSLRGRVQRTT
jgi:MFS transporter, DHA1 family, tetracycline resistance protein